jgi:hypothetical protein
MDQKFDYSNAIVAAPCLEKRSTVPGTIDSFEVLAGLCADFAYNMSTANTLEGVRTACSDFNASLALYL